MQSDNVCIMKMQVETSSGTTYTFALFLDNIVNCIITLVIELLLRMSHQHTFLLIYLHVNELVAIRLPAGILMGTFVVKSYGQELLHFLVVLY